jgi:hypothetical protein
MLTPPEMTSASLLLWIALGITLQLALWLGISFWRHWAEYQALRTGVRSGQALALPAAELLSAPSEAASVAAWSAYRNLRVARKEVEDGAQSICSFYLVPEDEQPLPAFLPGQFLTFRLDIPKHEGQSEQLIRCYSLSDAPGKAFYRVSIKRVPAPSGTAHLPGRSSNYFHDQVKPGDTLSVRAPGGHFHIDRSESPVVLIGGGIGITPMLSMLNWCLAEQPEREVWLYYGVRNGSEVIKRAELEALAASHPNFHLRHCFSDPLPDEHLGNDYQHRGRVDIALFRAELPLKPFHFYICGPTPMMESLVLGLEAWGVPESRVHYEAFGPASIKRKTSAVSAESVAASHSDIVVTFARSGKQLPWNPGTGNLLDFAEANGVKIDSGCRTGSCGSCQTTIKSGEVAYDHMPDFDPEAGCCLLCSCSPKTSLTLEA